MLCECPDSAEADLRGDALGQGPFYKHVIKFLGTVAEYPDLVLGNISHRTATFDGQPWNCSKQSMLPMH